MMEDEAPTGELRNEKEHHQFRSKFFIPLGDYDTIEVDDQLQEGQTRQDEASAVQRKQALERILKKVQAEAARETRDDIITLLPETSFAILKPKFEAQKKGMPQDLFIETLLEVCGPNETRPSHLAKLRSLISELFECIDINGNGGVDWDEFSSYMANAINAVQINKDNDMIPYTPLTRVDIPDLKCADVRYITGLDAYLSVERLRYPSQWNLHIIDARDLSRTPLKCNLHSSTSGVLPAERSEKHDGLRSSAASAYDEAPTTDKISAMANGDLIFPEEGSFQCYDFHPPTEQLIVGTGYHRLLFFDLRKDAPLKHRYQLRKRWWLQNNPMMIRWGGKELNYMISSDNYGTLNWYSIDDDPYNTITQVALSHRVHEAAVMDLVVLEGTTFATASMDKSVRITDGSRPERSFALGAAGPNAHRHHKGVLSVAFSPDHNVLVTSGYEFEPIMWMPISVKDPFITRLRDRDAPHKATICKSACIKGTPQVVTLDTSGVVKVWDIRKAEVVQSFHFETKFNRAEQELCHLQSCAVDPKRHRIVIFGHDGYKTSMYHFESKANSSNNPDYAHDAPIVFASYNEATKNFVTIEGRSLRLWNTKGSISSSLENLLAEQISCVCFDDRRRRLVIGTVKGCVSVHSYLNGGLTFVYSPHKKEVTTVCYMDRVRLIATGAMDYTVHIYDDGEEPQPAPIRVFPTFGQPLRAFFASSFLLVGDDRECVSVYEVSHNTQIVMRAKCWYPAVNAGVEGLKLQSRRTLGSEASLLANSEPQANDTFNELLRKTSTFAEITSLYILKPYSAFVSCDTAGFATIWAFKTHQESTLKQYSVLCRFTGTMQVQSSHSLDADRHAGSRNMSSVTSVHWHSTAMQIFISDDFGYISCFEVKPQLLSRVPKLDEEGNALPPPSKFTRGAKRLLVPKRVNNWKAHNKTITCMQLIEKSSLIVSGCEEGLVGIWKTTGVAIARLQQGKGIVSDVMLFPWKFEEYVGAEVEIPDEEEPATGSTLNTLGSVFRHIDEERIGVVHVVAPLSSRAINANTIDSDSRSVTPNSHNDELNRYGSRVNWEESDEESDTVDSPSCSTIGESPSRQFSLPSASPKTPAMSRAKILPEPRFKSTAERNLPSRQGPWKAHRTPNPNALTSGVNQSVLPPIFPTDHTRSQSCPPTFGKGHSPYDPSATITSSNAEPQSFVYTALSRAGGAAPLSPFEARVVAMSGKVKKMLDKVDVSEKIKQYSVIHASRLPTGSLPSGVRIERPKPSTLRPLSLSPFPSKDSEPSSAPKYPRPVPSPGLLAPVFALSGHSSTR